MADAPRNLLIILADQLRVDAVHGGLSRAVPTPNLDRLAAESVVWRDHHTVIVPCGPSRASLLTGCYGMNHRSVKNRLPLGRHLPTLATELRRIGREPLLFGYTDTQPDPAALDPNDPAHLSYTAPAPGFTEVQEMRDEAWAWLAHLRSRGYDVPDSGSDGFASRLYRPQGGVNFNPALYAAEDSDTAFLTDRTLAQLDVRKSRPWSALVTYIRPHPPFVAPAPYHDLVDPAALPDPAEPFDHTFFEAFHSAPSERDILWDFDGNQRALTDAQVARIRATYLGLVAELDHHVGRLLDWLDATGQMDETLVVFAADHGEMLGDLGVWGKMTPFRQASHIPLLIRDPDRAPAEMSAVTQSIDLVPTILSRLGAQVPGTMDGRNLDAVAQTEDPVAMIEIDLSGTDTPGRYETHTGHTGRSCRAAVLQDTRWRYVHFACGFAPMLFDTQADPACARDLAEHEPGQLARMQARLLEHRMRSGP